MQKQKGQIGVSTENIFPIIKKYLYSDHEIFLRELISNAIDATQKLKTLESVGEFKGEMGDLTIHVKINEKKKTLSIIDRGVGMTSEEIDKFINQVAFSGANEFLEKYKKDANAIIGHFGMGFYSSFMVAKKVEIITKSLHDGSKAVKWSCDGSPEFTLEEIEKEERGTEIILYIDDENKQFLEKHEITKLLNKYCRYLPIPIAFGKETEWKDGKEVETEKDNIINETSPLWTRKPADLTDEDYKKFYRDLYPMSEEPLFHIHLNVDYPFNLTGILYFPKIRNNIEVQKNKIQLFCNQVYVTDSIESIVPEFLTLLHGVIDSPDIPLNVSRSFLQSDSNVKKIANHITKKVADRLEDIFKNERKNFEEKWEDLKLFIEYGMLSEEKFNEKAMKFALLQNTNNKFFTFDEYTELIKVNQTDKDGNIINLYSTNKDEQYTFIAATQNKGYDVLLMNGYFDMHFLNHLEQKLEKHRYVRVDSDVPEKLISKEERLELKLTTEQREDLIVLFNSQLPTVNKAHFIVTFEGLGENDFPILITQNEFIRRMKDMSALGGAMSFYGELPDNYNLVVNGNHPLVNRIVENADKKIGEKVKSLREKITTLKVRKSELDEAKKDKKEEEIPIVEKEELEDVNKKISEQNNLKEELLKQYASKDKLISQLIDLALLSNNMLKGEALNRFVKRSVEMI